MIKKTLLSILLAFLILPSSNAQELMGEWMATIDYYGHKVNLTFQFIGEDDTKVTGLLGCEELNISNIPIPEISYDIEDRQMKFKLGESLNFEGVVLHANEIEGSIEFNNMHSPIKMERGIPYDRYNAKNSQVNLHTEQYTTEEIMITNEENGDVIAGTLTIPKIIEEYPLVILIPDHGPLDRDGTRETRKTMLYLADHLAQRGMASFRFDKRGIGQSGGYYHGATTMDFASDVDEVIKFFKNKKDIKITSTGLVGHGEGGLIAAISSINNPDIKFVVMMAAPGVKAEKIFLKEKENTAQAMGKSPEDVEKIKSAYQKSYQIILDGTDEDSQNEKIIKALRPLVKENSLESLDQDYLHRIAHSINTPWMKYYLTINPSSFYQKLKVPVLAIGGENDQEMDTKENLNAIKVALEKSKSKKADTESFPQVNHLLQDSRSGLITEYKELEDPIAHPVMDYVSHWIELLNHPQN